MAENENIYPTLNKVGSRTLSDPNINLQPPSAPMLESFRVESDFTKQVQDSRIRELQKLIDDLENLLIHYKKVKKRWTKFDSSIKVIGVTLASVTAATSAIIAPFNIPIIVSILAGASAGKVIITETLCIGFTSKKVKQYREINENINHTITKLFLYNQKAMSDNILTLDEIKKAYDIFKTLKEEIKTSKKK